MPTWVWVLIAILAVIVLLVVVSYKRDARRLRMGSALLAGASSTTDPVCLKCGPVYNRAVVIRLIKEQSPEIFSFQTWTTRLVCKTCRDEIVISGVRGE